MLVYNGILAVILSESESAGFLRKRKVMLKRDNDREVSGLVAFRTVWKLMLKLDATEEKPMKAAEEKYFFYSSRR